MLKLKGGVTLRGEVIPVIRGDGDARRGYILLNGGAMLIKQSTQRINQIYVEERHRNAAIKWITQYVVTLTEYDGKVTGTLFRPLPALTEVCSGQIRVILMETNCPALMTAITPVNPTGSRVITRNARVITCGA